MSVIGVRVDDRTANYELVWQGGIKGYKKAAQGWAVEVDIDGKGRLNMFFNIPEEPLGDQLKFFSLKGEKTSSSPQHLTQIEKNGKVVQNFFRSTPFQKQNRRE